MTDHEAIKKSIVDFKKMLESRVDYAFTQRDDFNNDEPFDELYRNNFTLSFMGKSCTIYFGATEYHAITDILREILEEM